ncbi:hypothetical protein RSAG8_08844, partial [Rhizoctonia solani AG-8 WAC10335]
MDILECSLHRLIHPHPTTPLPKMAPGLWQMPSHRRHLTLNLDIYTSWNHHVAAIPRACILSSIQELI